MVRHDVSSVVRVQAEPEIVDLPSMAENDIPTRLKSKVDENQAGEPSSRKKKAPRKLTGKSLKIRVLSRFFPVDYERGQLKILDPAGETIQKWSKIFLAASLISLFFDPLFFFTVLVRDEVCIDTATQLQTILTGIRSVTDVFYIIQIFIKFHTGHAAPSSRVLGRGELVLDSSEIALRYMSREFWFDIFVAMPLPQVLVWVIFPNLKGSAVTYTRNVIWFIITFQYLPRVLLIFPLSSKILETAGVVNKTAWAGAAYNLLIYMIASHFAGCTSYILTIGRLEACWKSVCLVENCQNGYFACSSVGDPSRDDWFKSSNVTTNCNPSNNIYPFGIFNVAAVPTVMGAPFFNKYLICLWWGLKNLSTFGQAFNTTYFIAENIFAYVIGAFGVVLLALLIGNVQRYLYSTTKRLEQWRNKRTDAEQWMRQRQLPPGLGQTVKSYNKFQWLATRGVNEEALLRGLPTDLQTQIKRHLCLDLVRQVPLFDEMDEAMLDAIYLKLKTALYSKGMLVACEGHPVNQMLFIIRGHLDSSSRTGIQNGFLNSCCIGPGDFCGEELVTWALEPPRPNVILPSSTRTIKAMTEVEACALAAEDLKSVTLQFKRMQSKELRHRFRYYSHQWRTWAACFIQAAWRQHKFRCEEWSMERAPGTPIPGSFWSNYAEALVASARMNIRNKESGSDSGVVSPLEKPAEPEFFVDDN